MAGTNIFGLVDAKTTFVSKSSARPCANLAIKSAVAGAIKIASESLAKEICGTSSTSLHRSLYTLRPESAAHVAAPTKFKLHLVGNTVTTKPLS